MKKNTTQVQLRRLTLAELREEFGIEDAEALYNEGKVWGFWRTPGFLVSATFASEEEANAAGYIK